jgi:hypothetical protein
LDKLNMAATKHRHKTVASRNRPRGVRSTGQRALAPAGGEFLVLRLALDEEFNSTALNVDLILSLSMDEGGSSAAVVQQPTAPTPERG